MILELMRAPKARASWARGWREPSEPLAGQGMDEEVARVTWQSRQRVAVQTGRRGGLARLVYTKNQDLATKKVVKKKFCLSAVKKVHGDLDV